VPLRKQLKMLRKESARLVQESLPKIHWSQEP
jgi:hypothetical protein